MNLKLTNSLGLSMALSFLVSTSVFAQQEPEAPEQQSYSNVLVFNCTIKNPQDLANSSVLGNYSVRPNSAVQLGIRPAEGVVVVSLQLSAGRYSLTPRDPRVYKTKIKSAQQLKSGQLILKNINLDDTDYVKMSLSPTSEEVEGVISTYGAELNITCVPSEDN